MAGINIIEIGYHTNGAQARVRAGQQRLQAGFPAVLTHVANIEVEELQKLTPISHSGAPDAKPGQLKKNWAISASGSGSNARRIVYNRLARIRFIIKGRRAIDQTLKEGDQRHPLHFWIDGREFYRWKVKAARANNFVPQALSNARSRAVPIVHRELMNAIFTRDLTGNIQ
jgi:hypothetical protein